MDFKSSNTDFESSIKVDYGFMIAGHKYNNRKRENNYDLCKTRF